MPDAPIFVATDLSARSDRPLDRAAQLAHELGAPLIVVHVVEAETIRLEEESLARARPILDREARDLGQGVSAMLLTGSPPEALAAAAEQANARLLVVGPARYNELRDLFLGTAVDSLLRRATVPILLVKRRPREPYARVLVATDFSEPSREALLVAAELFPAAQLTLVHAYTPSFPSRADPDDMRELALQLAREEAAKFLAHPSLEAIRPRMRERLEEGAAAPTVEKTAKATAADLVVIGAQGASGWVQAVIGSKASEIISWSTRDLLVVRSKRR